MRVSIWDTIPCINGYPIDSNANGFLASAWRLGLTFEVSLLGISLLCGLFPVLACYWSFWCSTSILILAWRLGDGNDGFYVMAWRQQQWHAFVLVTWRLQWWHFFCSTTMILSSTMIFIWLPFWHCFHYIFPTNYGQPVWFLIHGQSFPYSCSWC